ncbi:MAG: efflux transporter outer membrane subunit, partial [Burkholderiales bacterium]|nr:efflux transporter outer membrane subunit [Burkholderiales bacterium]
MTPLRSRPHGGAGRALALAAALALAGCALTRSPPPQPAVALPETWVEPAPPSPTLLAQDWWNSFGSGELSALVASALAGSPDLAIAAQRVRQAQAQLQIAAAPLLPALGAGASTSRQESRGDTLAGPSTRDSSSANLAASYEIDLWGRIGAGIGAAEASLRASRYERETARLTLLAGVANAYFQVLSIRGRLALARENIAIAERVFAVVNARFRFGSASALDVSRQQTALLSLRAALPPLAREERQALAALAILAGRAPGTFGVSSTRVGDIAVPSVAPDLPAQVLARRPDIASAEAQLAAANANVTAARAALLPEFSLSSSVGLSSARLLSLADSPLSAVTLGASLLAPIFDGGRLRGQAALSSARELELVESYRKAILAALADVETALVAVNRTAEQEHLQ